MKHNDSCYICEIVCSEERKSMEKFLRQYNFCEICKKNKSSKILINNGVFVAICNECADGMKVIENGKERFIRTKRIY